MQEQLRRISLKYQGLLGPRPFERGITGTAAALERLGYIQIDTLSVVERAHHHTLWTRNPDYRLDHLNQLVQTGRAFEYWFHAASFLPMSDYRFSLALKERIKRGDTRFGGADPQALRYVYDRIKAEGPLRARDFESKSNKPGSWWNWKPAKRALEQRFMQGDLMIKERAGMQKVYDLTERVLPADVNTTPPTADEFANHIIDHALAAYGFTTLKQILHLRTDPGLRQTVQNILQARIAEGLLVELKADALPAVFAPPDLLEQRTSIPANNLRLLSPFDNAIIHRDRMEALFDFSYRLECYLPAAKRQFGYFCLPILYRDLLVGSVDCKAHRDKKRFELIHLHLQPQKFDADRFVPLFIKTVRRFAKFNDCQTVFVTKISPRKMSAAIQRALKETE